MKNNDWNSDEIIRLITAKGKVSQLQLLAKLKEVYDEDIPQPTFANRLRRNSLRLRELQQICEVLGYDLILHPKQRGD